MKSLIWKADLIVLYFKSIKWYYKIELVKKQR